MASGTIKTMFDKLRTEVGVNFPVTSRTYSSAEEVTAQSVADRFDASNKTPVFYTGTVSGRGHVFAIFALQWGCYTGYGFFSGNLGYIVRATNSTTWTKEEKYDSSRNLS